VTLSAFREARAYAQTEAAMGITEVAPRCVDARRIMSMKRNHAAHGLSRTAVSL
jgi:hypothetical protein